MARNPVERNFVTQFLLGIVVITGMFVGGGVGGYAVGRVGVPYDSVVGVMLGSLLVFAAFAVWYSRYDAAFSA